MRILAASTWDPIAELVHPITVDGPPDLVVYKEEQQRGPADGGATAGGKGDKGGDLRRGSGAGRSSYVLRDLPLDFTNIRVLPAEKPNPKVGIGANPLLLGDTMN